MNWLKTLQLDGIRSPLDQIWNGPGINYYSVLADYGKEGVALISSRMPNMLKKKGGEPLDCAASEYGFESADALYQAMVNYKSKRQMALSMDREYEHFLEAQSSEECPF